MNAANQRNNIPQWSDIAGDEDFQSADWQTRQKVRGEFFRRVVEPNTPNELLEEVRGKFFTVTEADVFGDRGDSAVDAPDAQNRQQAGGEVPGLVSNALRNAGERGLDLTGNAIQFIGNMAEMGERLITDYLGGFNPGVIGGEADAMRARGYEPDVELGGYGLDFTARAKPEDTNTGLVGAGQAVEDVGLGYQPNYTIDRALEEPSLETLAGAVAEQGPAALADMAALVVNPPAYLASRTQEIGEARVENDDREGMPEARDYAVAGPTAAASVLLDRFALSRLLPGGKGTVSRARQVPGAVGRAAVIEGTTEAIQEGGIEYAGESVGTKAGWDPVTAGRRAAGGAIVGGPTGGAVRAGTATSEAARGSQAEEGSDSEQDDTPAREEQSGQPTPEAQQANAEAVGAAAELIRRPRFELSSAERKVRDSITYGDAFKALRSAAEAQGNSEAVAELDAVSEEVSAALEAEILARTRDKEADLKPIRQRLNAAAQRFTAVMDSINEKKAQAESDSQRAEVERAAAETDVSPTQAQAEAGNYRKGKVRLNGFEIAIENPKGSTRRGTGPDGTEWESKMAHHYGDIKGTIAADGDNLDVFVGDNPGSQRIFIVDQVNEDGSFDEHKVMLGFDSLEEARQGYLANYDEGWQGLGEITETGVEGLKGWLRDGAQELPFGDLQTPASRNAERLGLDPGAAPPMAPAAMRGGRERRGASEAEGQGVTLKADGTPFQTRRAAELSRRFRETPGAVPVEVDGGWGVAVPADVSGRPDEGEREPAQRQEADPAEGATEAPEVDGTPLMETYTEKDVAQREQAAQQAQEEEVRTRREAEQRAAADRKADESTLSGSDIPVNQAAAHGQDALFALTGEGARNAGSRASAAPRAEFIRARLAEHPDLSVVEVVQSIRDLPTGIHLLMALQGVTGDRVSGVYNPDTGAPMIVADNLIDEADAIRKAVHEGVGHYGIRGMLGEELEPLMLEIYQSHTRSESGRRNIEEIQQAYPFIDVATRKGKITLAEGLVAHYIEDSNGRPHLSQRIKSTIRRLLRKLFPGIQWRTSDILVMGDQARRWLRRQQAVRDLGDADNRYSFAEEQSELSPHDLATQLREEFPGLKLDLMGHGQHVTLSRIVVPEREQGTGSAAMRRLIDWADASGRTLALTPSSGFGGSIKRLREFYRRFGFVDNKGRNKDYEISEAMYREPDRGVGEVRFSIAQQPGTAGGRFSSTDSTGFAMPDEGLRNAALRKMADKMRPLKILEEAIRRTGRDIEEEADAYLAEELFHGKAEYDLRQLREQYVEPLAEGLAKAKISQAELDNYLYARHAPERNATIAERNPDNPEMQDGGSGMTNAQAAEIIERVANSGKQAEYDRLANLVYEMTRLRREAIREGGLEDEAVVDAWEANWQYYVPLKGSAADEPGRPRIGRGFEISGRESRIAGGRKTLAESPSSQVIVDANESLIRRRKNEVAQSLLSLVTDNPNPSLWEVFTDDNPDTQRTPIRVTDPETRKIRIEVQERPVNMVGNDRYFKAKRAGRTYYLKLHDERLMNAMRNVGPENNGALIRAAGAVTRAMAALATSYNPEFMLTNFTRDVQTALLNLSAEQTRDDGKIKGEAIVRQTARDIGPAMRAAWRGLQGKAGRDDGSREWDRWFQEFQEDGAKTGYFDMKDIGAQAKEIQSMVRRADGTTLSHMLKARKKTADFVENVNGAVENAVRLSAYANARRAGISRKKAASLAKNMTVNFNRRGEAGTALNAAYMFANASIQGAMNFARTMVTVKNAPEGKSQWNVWSRMNLAQKLGLGLATGSFMLGMLNRWASEEDEDGVLFYDKIPDYVKERNLVVMSSLWGGEPDDYIKIPLPYGYNVFSVVGTHAEAVAAGTENPAEAAKNLVLAVLGSFSPIGFEDSDEAHSLFLKNLTPTIFRSITQIGVNENFSGSPIYREDFPFGTPTPDSSRAFSSTPDAYKGFARFLNEFTGGTDNISGAIDVSPDVMQHLVNYYGGGAWEFVEKVADFAKRTATGEEVERYRVPFAGRFMSDVSDYGDMQRFYERRDELGQIANEAESLRGRERIEYRREHQQQIRLFNRATDLEKRLSELRNRRDRIEKTETLTDQAKKRRIETIEKQMQRWVDNFNRRYNEIE